MPTYKLTYFNVRGRAEVSRVLFAKAGVPYEDCRIQREQWMAMKDKTPFGGLPVLEVDGVQIGESMVIATFLAKRFGLLGKTDIEAAQIEAICSATSDILSGLVPIFMEKDEAKKAELKKTAQDEKLPNLLKYLNRILGNNKFFVGDSMTLADIYFTCATEGVQMVGIKFDFSDYPKLAALKGKVEADPKIADWLKNRPETPM